MPRKRKKKKAKVGYSQQVMLVLTGSALTLCCLSIMYGFLIRKSMAESEIRELRIEVLNGTGEKGLAKEAASALRRMGVDVLHVDNADNFSYAETILIARRAGLDLDGLSKSIGCDNTIEQRVEDSLVDATLIIGSDFESLRLDIERESSLRE